MVTDKNACNINNYANAIEIMPRSGATNGIYFYLE